MTTHSLTRRIAARATICAALTVAVAGWTVGLTQADYTPMPIAPSVIAPAPVWTAPCLSEDGSDPAQVYPCLWEGDDPDTGNGVGLTFTISRGATDTELCYRYADPKAEAKYGECADVL